VPKSIDKIRKEFTEGRISTLDIEAPGNLSDLFGEHGLMDKSLLKPANQHGHRRVTSGLESFAHLFQLHAGSASSKPDRDRPGVVPTAGSEFFPRLAPLVFDCRYDLFLSNQPKTSGLGSGIVAGLVG
jgi:hypothetical protein